MMTARNALVEILQTTEFALEGAARAGSSEAAREMALLFALGLFDGPLGAGDLATLTGSPVIPGPLAPLHAQSESQIHESIRSLRRKRIVLYSDRYNPDQEREVDCHPLVQEYFRQRFIEVDRAAFRESHARLYDFYRSLSPGVASGFTDLVPLVKAIGHATEAGLAQDAFDNIYMPKVRQRTEHAVTSSLGAFAADLGILSGFYRNQWQELREDIDDITQIAIRLYVGKALFAVGRVREAIAPTQQVVSVAKRLRDFRAMADAHGTLALLKLYTGAIGDAVEEAKIAVEISDANRDRFGSATYRLTLAHAFHFPGLSNGRF
jgi:hypothetical protein